jgi:hypothetical protein
MNIGAPTNTISRYRVSHAHELVRSYLMARPEDIIIVGKHRQHRWALELQFYASTTVRLFATPVSAC